MRGVTGQFITNAPRYSFQLTRLMRGVTWDYALQVQAEAFQLTRLMRGVTVRFDESCDVVCISTHTPHARRDSVKCMTIL